MNDITFYRSIPLQKIPIEDVEIGFRQIGEGEDLVFIHGFPTHGYTWRKLLPSLSKKYRCSILDLAGLGDSNWSETTDFNSTRQANYVMQLLDQKGIEKFSLIAHNSGATVARVIAIKDAKSVNNLILFNTEIPQHRPPWIPFYQVIGQFPMVPSIIQRMINQQSFVQSSMGFKEAYSDKSMFRNEDNLGPYLNPIMESHRKAVGAFKYLKGIDWKLIDEFEHTHQNIQAKVLFIWGEDDRTFPIELAKKMLPQFETPCEFKTIENASLLPHEEKPKEVVGLIMDFLGK